MKRLLARWSYGKLICVVRADSRETKTQIVVTGPGAEVIWRAKPEYMLHVVTFHGRFRKDNLLPIGFDWGWRIIDESELPKLLEDWK